MTKTIERRLADVRAIAFANAKRDPGEILVSTTAKLMADASVAQLEREARANRPYMAEEYKMDGRNERFCKQIDCAFTHDARDAITMAVLRDFSRLPPDTKATLRAALAAALGDTFEVLNAGAHFAGSWSVPSLGQSYPPHGSFFAVVRDKIFAQARAEATGLPITNKIPPRPPAAPPALPPPPPPSAPAQRNWRDLIPGGPGSSAR